MNAIAPAPFRSRAPVIRPPEPPAEGKLFFVVTGLIGAVMFVLCAIALVSAAAVIRTTL